MKALVLALVVLVFPLAAFAQQDVTVSLTAGQVKAIQEFAGQANIAPAVRQQVKQWAQHLVTERQERRRLEWIEAIDKATPEVTQQIKALLALPEEDTKVSAKDKTERRLKLLAEACVAYNATAKDADKLPCPKLAEVK